MSVTFTDIFCGAGGSSCGLAAAGFELALAANHWARAIETHSANFRDAEHLCADINNYDMRRLPRTDILWASPICTEISPAGGRRRSRGQIDLFEEDLPDAAFDRTRATAHDVIRATEVHRYSAVLVENVVEFATDWELFDWWLNGMTLLGYQHQIVSVSSAHAGGITNPHAPQWRDRLYIVFVRDGIRTPDVTPRPWAWCFECGQAVRAVQTWRNPRTRKIGKYLRQYHYTCPNSSRRHESFVVEPFVRPAAAAIDWSDPGIRIGDRSRPLAANTLARVRAGLEMIQNAPEPILVTVNHGGEDGRPMLASDGPLPTRTGKIGEALVTPMVLPVGGANHDAAPTTVGEPLRTRMTRDTDALVTAAAEPFIAELRNHCDASPASEPLSTLAGARHHAVVRPFFMKNYGGNADARDMVKPVTDPFGTVTSKDHHSLVIPFRQGNRPTSTGEPLHTLSTRDSAALVQPAIDVEDCYLRMLQPHEALAAQRFPADYICTGTKGEQTKQAGNAVSANVAQWIAEAVAQVL